jgi:hypothetical protein
MIADSSNSRPWNILGSGGNNDREFELDDLRMSLIWDERTHLCLELEKTVETYEMGQ